MLDEKLLQERLNQFKPEPLVDYKYDPDKIIERKQVPTNENVIDLSKTNFLDVLNNEKIKSTAEEYIRKYGVGTCGPRAFYGTTDVHLNLEEGLAKFLGTEECIIYSYGFVAISSSIAAYCKKNDIVFVDKDVNAPIMKGLIQARSQIVYFNSQEPESLRIEAEKIKEMEKRPKRKFLIVEGINWKTGRLCPLPELIDIAETFKMRIFLEETYSLGVLGNTGRGMLEHFNLPNEKVDMIFGTVEGAIGSIGGFCAGSHAVIEHQRLSGSGYIFSASLPTYLAQVVLKSLEMLGDQPLKLVELAHKVHQFLINKCDFEVTSHPVSPFKVFSTKKPNCNVVNEKIYRFCAENEVHFIKEEHGLVMNLNVNLLNEPKTMKRFFSVLEHASKL